MVFNMSKGKSNLKIENAIKNVGVDDSNDHFVVVFPSNHMNKVINHAAVYRKKRANIPLLLLTLTAVKKEGHTGGVY